jgi:hypothetical protein
MRGRPPPGAEIEVKEGAGGVVPPPGTKIEVKEGAGGVVLSDDKSLYAKAVRH